MAFKRNDPEVTALRWRCYNEGMTDKEIAIEQQKLTGKTVTSHAILQWRLASGNLPSNGQHGGVREGAGSKPKRIGAGQLSTASCPCDGCRDTLECVCHMCNKQAKCYKECRIVYHSQQLNEQRAKCHTNIETKAHKGGTPTWLKHKTAQRLLI